MSDENSSSKFSTVFLVIVLVAMSFLAGSLFNSFRSEKPSGSGEETQPTVANQPQAQPKAGSLTDSQLADLVKSENVKGPEDAPIVMVEFSEYECPFCKRYVDEAYSQIMDKYGDKIRYYFRDFPLSFHPHAQQNAEAARCAGEQGDYFGYHDLLFANRDEWVSQTDATKTLVGYARELGLNAGQFESCLTSGKYTQAVKDDFTFGQSVGVSGTPAFFINGQFVSGAQPFSVFQGIIEQELAK